MARHPKQVVCFQAPANFAHACFGLRGLDDDGNPVGSHTAEHMRIWLNSQSWMVISGAGKKEQHIHA
ncbi:MAG: hypothetical protein IJ975_00410, partial [Clostridia bacterium]|nr:hypothetical protein [Clostridia bacterium]